VLWTRLIDLTEAGASEEKARAAATSLAGRDQRWDEVGQRLQRVDQRLDSVEHRLDGVEQRLGTVERRLDLVEQALEAVTRRIAALEERMAALEDKVIAPAQDVAVIRAELGLMKWMHGITIGGVLALLIKTFFG
jgi:chromosome segregation ATPase